MLNLEKIISDSKIGQRFRGISSKLYLLLLAAYLIFNPNTAIAQQSQKAVCTPYIQDGKLYANIEYGDGKKESRILIKESGANAIDVIKFKEIYSCPPPKQEKPKEQSK